MVFYYFAYGVHLYLRVVYFHESLNVLNLHTFVFCFESTDDNNDGICAVPKSGTILHHIWCYYEPNLVVFKAPYYYVPNLILLCWTFCSSVHFGAMMYQSWHCNVKCHTTCIYTKYNA